MASTAVKGSMIVYWCFAPAGTNHEVSGLQMQSLSLQIKLRASRDHVSYSLVGQIFSERIIARSARLGCRLLLPGKGLGRSWLCRSAPLVAFDRFGGILPLFCGRDCIAATSAGK